MNDVYYVPVVETLHAGMIVSKLLCPIKVQLFRSSSDNNLWWRYTRSAPEIRAASQSRILTVPCPGEDALLSHYLAHAIHSFYLFNETMNLERIGKFSLSNFTFTYSIDHGEIIYVPFLPWHAVSVTFKSGAGDDLESGYMSISVCSPMV